MFVREPFVAPPGSKVSHEVKYKQGRKPFPTLKEAEAFAAEQRALDGGWAEISLIVSIVVSARS